MGISSSTWYGRRRRASSAVVAGHIIECGTQATGGNFSGFLDLPHRDRPLGFPIAELAEDGSMVITKHDGTGGAVTVDTVTAQLVYEIQSTHYLNPDVTVDLTSLASRAGRPRDSDRVAVTGVTGSAPPEQLKVCLNYFAGFRNSAEFVVTGLDADAKVEWITAQVETALGRGAGRPAKVEWSGVRTVQPDADTEEGASMLLRVTAFDPDNAKVSKGLTAPIIELALGSYPGFSVTRMPGPGTAYGVYSPAYIPRSSVQHTVVHHDGTTEVIDDPKTADVPIDPAEGQRPSPYPAPTDTLTRRLPLGTFVHGRSGDKGGDANIGLWVKNDGHPKYAERVTWLTKFMSRRRVRELIPEAADLEVEVYVLPNLGGVNVLIHGLLDEGVAATARFDPQAKGLAEWIRSRLVNIEGNVL